MMNNDKNLEIISEILQGVTVVSSSFGTLYFKHLLQQEQRQVISMSSVFKKEAESKGLLTEEQSLKELADHGMWGEDEENKIKEYKKEIEMNKISMSAQVLPSKIKALKNKIDNTERELLKISLEKESLMGLTCEKFVNNKIQKTIVERIIFLDKDFKNPVFDALYMNEKAKESEVYKLQKEFFEKFQDENISIAVLSDYFGMYLPFCEDILGVFGKPLINLTSYQLKLISYARYFLNIFKNSTKDIPENVAKDPELLTSFYQNQRSEKTSKRSTQGDGASVYFGADKEDIESIKANDEKAIDLTEEIKKRGGSLNMEQMMKLHGV